MEDDPESQSRIPDDTSLIYPRKYDRPSPPDANEVAWTYSQCSVNHTERDAHLGSDLCKQLEFHRRSADYYLSVYLEDLDRIEEISVCFDPFDCPQELFAWTEQHSQRDAARLNILSDGAIRGLVVMERILNHVHLQAISMPPSRTWVPKVIWTAACSFSAVTIPAKFTASLAAAGAIAGAIGLVLPPIWNFIHRGKLEKAQKKVQNLKRAFEERTIEERNRHDLEPSQFSFLRWVVSKNL
ncbi:hypothetical protein FDECE_497 [Fusarium decemcellulare]|nr:hypothetical protein FDECE_497 [Fusarium decemcellulare]